MIDLRFWRPFIAVSLIFAVSVFVFAYLEGHRQPRLKALGIALLAALLATAFLVFAFGKF